MDHILPVLAYVLAHSDKVLEAVGALVICASTIVKLTPSEKDDVLLAKFITAEGKVVAFLNHFSVFNPSAPK